MVCDWAGKEIYPLLRALATLRGGRPGLLGTSYTFGFCRSFCYSCTSFWELHKRVTKNNTVIIERTRECMLRKLRWRHVHNRSVCAILYPLGETAVGKSIITPAIYQIWLMTVVFMHENDVRLC